MMMNNQFWSQLNSYQISTGRVPTEINININDLKLFMIKGKISKLYKILQKNMMKKVIDGGISIDKNPENRLITMDSMAILFAAIKFVLESNEDYVFDVIEEMQLRKSMVFVARVKGGIIDYFTWNNSLINHLKHCFSLRKKSIDVEINEEEKKSKDEQDEKKLYKMKEDQVLYGSLSNECEFITLPEDITVMIIFWKIGRYSQICSPLELLINDKTIGDDDGYDQTDKQLSYDGDHVQI